MKVLGLVGSPRKASNTDLLIDAFLNGAAQANYLTEKIYLYDVDIKACVDCGACKKQPYECLLKDDMSFLYHRFEEADTIVFGTPLYWYGPTAKMKLLQDRLRPFVASNKLEGKKAILIVPSEEGSKACNHMVGMFRLSINYLGMKLTNVLLPKASKRAEIKAQPNILRETTTMGKELR